ncbi:hypothetical protein [Stieleria varia]|uniref:Uncharacterized protein n=1 Tax=Stieleria varia TaxID=2528005 RepID=A0A5C6AP48_9BACT|nr:hypothetical protein [Stieleria varia]TWU00886.1 hypothetical protein Pla52n_42550 [Stieleria varia]
MRHEPHHCTKTLDDQIQQDCLLYLLGELSADRQADFEASLCDSAIADELNRQSELLIRVSHCKFETPVHAETSTKTNLDRNPHSPALPRWRVAVSLLAIAATVLILVTLNTSPGSNSSVIRTSQAEQPSVDLMIAKAWVEQPGSMAMDDVPNLSSDWLTPEEFETQPTEESLDESFSWMVVAVAAGDDIDG